MVQVTYQLTEKICRRAIRAKLCSSWTARSVLGLVVIMAFLAAVSLAVGGPHRTPYQSLAPLAALVLVALVWILGLGPYLGARSMCRDSPIAQSPITMDATTTGLNFRSTHANYQVQWTLFVKWAEHKPSFALFISPESCTVIPKQTFAPEQLDEFRELLRQNVPKKVSGR